MKRRCCRLCGFRRHRRAVLAAPAGAEEFKTNKRGEVILPKGIEKRPVAEKFQRKAVRLSTSEKPGTVIVDTNNRFLYFVEGPEGDALRYWRGPRRFRLVGCDPRRS